MEQLFQQFSNDYYVYYLKIYLIKLLQLTNLRMKLYNISLKSSTSIIKVLHGTFSGAKEQEIILAKSRSIELYRINQQGKLQLLTNEQLFCVIRNVVIFRMHGTNKDRIIIGSDSGKIVILEYMPEKNHFIKTHEETFGKSGCRRIVPGQHIAVDPRGRAVMIAAIQKQKFVYVLTREDDKTIIQSPRDAHKSYSICMDIVALDMGNDNAFFVCLQIEYGEVENKQALVNVGGVKKSIVYYQTDFGMNTVIRKKQVQVDPTAHMLIPVPGSNQGPGGVIVLLQDFLLYRGNDRVNQKKQIQKGSQHVIRFPRRKNRPGNRKTQFTAHTIYKDKGFFFLIASELGDLFKVEFKLKDQKQVISIKIQYFDTVSCLTSMALTKGGYLFCAGEKQDHVLYALVQKEGKYQKFYTHSQMQNSHIVQFTPSRNQEERQLLSSDRIEQFGPTTEFKAITYGQNNKNLQMYMLNASGPGKSFLRIIKQGLRVKQRKKNKFHPPNSIWSVRGPETNNTKMIIMGYPNKIHVFSLGDHGFSSTTQPGIQVNVKTLFIGRLRDDSLIQITQNGFRHITKTNVRPTKIEGTILRGIIKGGQMVLALQGGDVIYYQLDENGDVSQVQQATLDDQVVDMDLSPIQKDRIRSNFLVLGLRANSIKILDLNVQNCLKVISEQKTKDLIESVVIQEMQFENDQDEQKYGKKLYIYAGLKKGLVIRTSVDVITGKMMDLSTYILGQNPVKFVKMIVQNRPGILALAQRPWLIYAYDNKQIINPLSYSHLDLAVPIISQSSPHTLCGFSQKNFTFLTIQNFGEMLHSETVPLTYSGRKLFPFDKHLAIVESDKVIPENEENLKWKCQVSIFSTEQKAIKQQIKLDDNQVCTGITFSTITQKQGTKEFLVISCSKGLTYSPKMFSDKNKIKVYERIGGSFQFYHETEIQDISLVLHSWDDKILAGVGSCMRAYEIGRKKMLRKAQIKNLSSPVNSISSVGRRIFVTELCDSFHMYTYKQREQTFYDIADDILPRFVTTSCNLDTYTMIGADKFENIFVSRVPRNAEDDFDNNPNTYKFQREHGYLNGAPFKMQQIANFYVGQVVTSIQKAQMESSGKQIILYSTINGGINALISFDSRQNVDFFTHLEMYLSKLLPNLSGRDHLSYRSYYNPCKGVIDGDLCEVYIKLPYSEQVQIAKLLDLTPHDIHKKLEEMRRYLI